jgi:hypothetical protein
MVSFRVALTLAAILVLQGCSAQASPIDSGKVEAATTDEERERDAILGSVRSLIDRKDFAGLDAMELGFRTSRARSPSGVWKLAVLHSGLQYYLGEGIDKEHGCTFAQAPFLTQWRSANPDGPAAIITEADLLRQQAWCYRGSGYAAEVADSAWPAFHAGIDKAHALLRSHHKVASVDPEYYAVMSVIYRSKGMERAEFMRLIDEGASREPYYHRIYFKAVWSFLPQWGGSFEEVDEFARYAANRTRTSENTGFYARVYWSLVECGCVDIARQVDWDTMKQGMRDVFERYPVAYNAQYFRDLSCQKGDLEEGKRYIRALTPEALSDNGRIILFKECEIAASAS